MIPDGIRENFGTFRRPEEKVDLLSRNFGSRAFFCHAAIKNNAPAFLCGEAHIFRPRESSGCLFESAFMCYLCHLWYAACNRQLILSNPPLAYFTLPCWSISLKNHYFSLELNI